MPNIRELARRANVSVATASRALNNHPNVSESTRLTVVKTALEIGYPISRLENLPQISRSVLVLTRIADDSSTMDQSSTHHEFNRSVWSGVHSVFDQMNITTRFQQSRMSVEEAQQYANDVGVSGVVILGGIINRNFVLKLSELNMPFVVVGSHLHPFEVNVVMADVFRGMRLAMQHLIERGRRKICLVNGPLTTTTSEEKYAGLRLSLSLNDLPFDPSQTVLSDFTPEDGYSQTLKLVAQNPDVDAIVYADDSIALGGLHALKELGKRIPEDIAITSFGNYEAARYTDPPLTTIQYDMHLMGALAARRICNLISEPDEQPFCMIVPVSLIVRGSS